MKWFGKESKILEDQYQDISGKTLPKGFLKRVCAVVFSENGQLALGVAKIIEVKQNHISQDVEQPMEITPTTEQGQWPQPQPCLEQPDLEPRACD